LLGRSRSEEVLTHGYAQARHGRPDSSSELPDMATALSEEQHLTRDLRVLSHEGVIVVVPPLYHRVITAKLRIPAKAADLQGAQKRLQHVLDELDHMDAAERALFDGRLDFWEKTSVRNGFIGGGFDGGPGLPKQKALEAGIPGADSIPDGAELFLGFTSSQKAALGGDMVANFESIPGLTDQWPGGYFRFGTAMHLSHLYEDLEGWYKQTYTERVDRTFRPGLGAAAGTQTVHEGPAAVRTLPYVRETLEQQRLVGHSAAFQPATRLPADLIDNYGNFYPQGSPIPIRADCNTLDNPFSWSCDPVRDKWSPEPMAGLLFTVFVPTSSAFHRARLTMDGHYPDGTILDIDPRSPHQGMNSFLHTTHRQNFLIPPRRHRSFPLAELL